MFRFRALLSCLLAMVAFVLVSCGGPSRVEVPPTYTEAQIQKIQQYLPEIQSAYGRLDALGDAIQDRNWQEVRSTIRGPFGSMIQDLKYVTSNLLPADQKVAREISRDIFQDFIEIDQAAIATNTDAALRNFDKAAKDIDAFLGNLPEVAATVTEDPDAGGEDA
ncbi:photosystem II protein PsbQ [Altericista sp. CCNU0014]|uniref:photosystem II protein PsbQ n=1 Tax=Altericista sp. CCNU0014 TaxID=3082949 RepID=UPI00384A614E